MPIFSEKAEHCSRNLQSLGFSISVVESTPSNSGRTISFSVGGGANKQPRAVTVGLCVSVGKTSSQMMLLQSLQAHTVYSPLRQLQRRECEVNIVPCWIFIYPEGHAAFLKVMVNNATDQTHCLWLSKIITLLNACLNEVLYFVWFYNWAKKRSATLPLQVCLSKFPRFWICSSSLWLSSHMDLCSQFVQILLLGIIV